MKLRLDIGRQFDSESGSRPLFFSNGVTTACFITLGTVDDSIDIFMMRVSVSTGASVPMFAVSNVEGIYIDVW